ncbi:MAG: RCC1 repeat-containing protein, partial [Deltaproteobacteria bacterium]|nr:RCC1 repeat-containing protein [Deltaproteobacteria bacterium]
TAVATGDYHTLFITTGGCLWTMGDNYDGQLGDGTNIDRHSPTPVPGHSTGVTQVAAGDYFSLFIKSDGSLWVVGDNYDGQLGDGTTNDRNVPYKLINSGVTAVAAGDNHSMYLTTGGALWVMGDNSDGQLGDGQILDYPYDRLTPYQIVASGVIAIDGGDTHSLFVKSGESLWAMGNNDYGQLGDGTDDDRNTPVMIVSSGVTAVSAAEHHSLFRKSDGTLWAMGDNYYGQLGDGTTDERLSPVQVPNVKASQISAGYEHSLFVGTASNAQPGAALPARNLLLLSD